MSDEGQGLRAMVAKLEAMADDICGRTVTIDGATFVCNLEPDHQLPGRLGIWYDHRAQGDVPVRFTLIWRVLP